MSVPFMPLARLRCALPSVVAPKVAFTILWGCDVLPAVLFCFFYALAVATDNHKRGSNPYNVYIKCVSRSALETFATAAAAEISKVR